MKKMKPFKGRIRRFAEGGDPDESGTYESGVRVGQNANISDDVRARAMARAARANLGKDPELESQPAERPAAKSASKPTAKPAATDTGDETARLEKRGPVDPGYRKGTLEDPEYRKTLEKKQALESVHPEEYIVGGGTLKALQKGAAALAARGSALKTIGESTANRLAGPAARKALPAPAEKSAARLEGVSPRPPLSGGAAKALPAPRPATRTPPRKPPRDVEEARMSGEGGAFRKGGSVRGCGIARKGFTKGKMR